MPYQQGDITIFLYKYKQYIEVITIKKPSYWSFLGSDTIDDKFGPINKNWFSEVWNELQKNELEDDDYRVSQVKHRYEPIVKNLVDCLKLRSMRYQTDKCGISWKRMRIKCVCRVNQLVFDKFNFSYRCICDGLKHNVWIQVIIHGGCNYLIQYQ